jgi:hypothetical protein
VVCQPLNPCWGKLKVATDPLARGKAASLLSPLKVCFQLELLHLIRMNHLTLFTPCFYLSCCLRSSTGQAQHPSQCDLTSDHHTISVHATTESISHKVDRTLGQCSYLEYILPIYSMHIIRAGSGVSKYILFSLQQSYNCENIIQVRWWEMK